MKKISNQARILKYIAKHPDAKATEISEKLNIGKSYVYLVMSKSKKVGNLDTLLTPKQARELAFQATQGRGKLRGRPPMRMRTVAIGLSDFSVKERMINTHAKDNVNQPEHYKVGGI